MKLKTWLNAAIVVAMLAPLGLGSAYAQPCASGFDVRNLDDSAISATIKSRIHGTPGPIVHTTHSQYPTGKTVVIRAASQDFPPNWAASISYVDGIFYGTGITGKNLRGYYQRNSYGQFLMSKGATPSYITLAKKLSDYPPGIEGNATYLKDVLKLANVNWAALDTNDDNVVSLKEAQIVILIPNAFPGSGFASVRTVNAGSVATPQGTFTFSNRRIVYFSLKAAAVADYDVDPIRELAAVAHELGHAYFNLPDRYGSNTGTGEFDMMASASSTKWLHLPIHDKMKIGWIAPKIIQAHYGDCLQFVPAEIYPAALVIIPPSMFMTNPLSEYWIVESRIKDYDYEGYDEDLPDDGLAIMNVSTGTALYGHDDLRLVDFSKAALDPDLYNNPGSNALFKLNPADPDRILLDRNGQWNLLWFQNVSDPAANYDGLFMFAEF